MSGSASRKVTVTLPEDLVSFADEKARQHASTRSAVITALLEEMREKERDRLAREGYQFYALEAEQFAESSCRAVAEAIGDDGSTW